MDTQQPQPFSSFLPEGEDEDIPSIPRRRVDGWVKVTYWNGREKILNVNTVRVFESVMAEQVYPPSANGHPVYLDMFPRGRLAIITEAEAHAWLRAHGLPVPGEDSAERGSEPRDA